jgi:hypothetical protein
VLKGVAETDTDIDVDGGVVDGIRNDDVVDDNTNCVDVVVVVISLTVVVSVSVTEEHWRDMNVQMLIGFVEQSCRTSLTKGPLPKRNHDLPSSSHQPLMMKWLLFAVDCANRREIRRNARVRRRTKQ